MILCDREIQLALEQGRIVIDPPPNPDLMDSTAVDLLLGESLDRWEFPETEPSLGQQENRFCPGRPGFKFSELEKKYTKSENISGKCFVLPPTPGKNFILGWTRERIYLPHTSRLCARVEGKSSLGRMGLGVHVTAPTIHAGFGFNSQNDKDHGARLRLEIWNVGPLPIELIQGMRICQLIIEEVREVPTQGYRDRNAFNQQGPKPNG